MAGFATEAALRTALDAQNVFRETYSKQSVPVGTSLNIGSAWRLGARPSAGADPATTPGTAYSNTAGGIVFPDISPLRKFLLSFNARKSQASQGGVFLYDRLVGVSGIAMSSTGDKTINSAALTRYTDGAGVEVYLEVTTAGNTTAPIVSLKSYTNQAGTSGKIGGTFTFTSATLGANSLVGPLPLASGDTGVRSVETLNVATAGGGSGVVNLILVKHIAGVGVGDASNPNQTSERQSPYPFTPLIRIFDGATLQILMRHNASAASDLEGEVVVVYG